jgi:PKD repeat protein
MINLSSFLVRTRAFGVAALAAGLVGMTASSAVSAETLMMPNRDMLAGTPEVVWGITTLPNSTSTYTIDYGDGVVTAPAAVADRSYIALTHTYATAGVKTAKLTVTNGATTETATVTLNVYNGASLSAFDLRNLNVNRAIEDGLRYLWYSQTNRTTFDTNAQTYWGNYANPFTALAVEAFQNHGYRLPNSNAAPTGIYPKYAVNRGFNYMLSRLTSLTIGTTPAGNDPCVSVPAPVCGALYANTTGDPGYENGIILLSLSGSGALLRTADASLPANVAGKSFGEILQRMVNATTWGQNDSGTGRGGWYYTFNSTSSDGSTNGWDLLALLSAEAAGATVPAWVKTEWALALAAGLNNDGSFDYQANGNRASNSSVNVAKTGVGVQGIFFAGRPGTDPDLALAKQYIGAGWQNQNPVVTPAGTTFQSFVCGNGTYNKGCSYGMYNVFKGFKLFGIQTLAGVNRAAGPGPIPSDDWYADYVDWLLANQTLPTTTTGGNWNALYFSSQTTNAPVNAAIALLILAPTALVLPDEELFSTVGLRHGNPLTTNPLDNPVTTPPGTHTVTATTEASNGSPIAGVTVTFRVISGPNAGATGSGNTAANGQVTFTYTDNGGQGTDNIQAFVGNIASNVLVKNWVVQGGIVCDVNNDGAVTMADLLLIRGKNGQNASGPTDPYDPNRDGKINVADVRFCQLRLTP